MSSTDLLIALRMRSLLLAGPPLEDAPAVAQWFGALQGQDLASVSWSLGLRTGQTLTEVAKAFDSGQIVRTWPMRGTLHVVPARDAAWMVRHLGARALAQARKRRESLGLADRSTEQAIHALEEALQGGTLLTRAECVEVMRAAGVQVSGQVAYHLLWYASQRAITCIGPSRGREQTFMLLSALAPDPVELERDEALAVIAERFVRGHGPVAAADLARWADLTMGDARAGLAAAEGVVKRSIDGVEYLVSERVLDPGEEHDASKNGGAGKEHGAGNEDGAGKEQGDARIEIPAALALPGFDEFILGYRDRTAQLPAHFEERVVPGRNGVFAPTLVADGRVVGIWRKKMRGKVLEFTATAFRRLSKVERGRLEQALLDHAEYLGSDDARVTWTIYAA